MNCYNRRLAALVVILAAASSSADKTDVGTTTNEMYCPDLKPQTSLDLEQIMGKWHVVEIVKHKIDPLRPMSNGGHVVVDTCPIVQLRFIGDRNLGLLWTEEAGDLDYSFVVPDLFRSPGFWTAKDLQNGTLLTRKYVQFVGTVQVMKAVASHMVLTFCSKTPDNQLYSMLLSRKHNLPESDSIGVQNLLSRRGLTIASVQESCKNSATGKESSCNSVTRWVTLVAAATLAAACKTGTTTGFGI